MNFYMKDPEQVAKNTKESKRQFIDQVLAAADEQDITSTELGIRADTSPAATARMKDANENITLNSMNKFAAAVGKKVEIKLVPDD